MKQIIYISLIGFLSIFFTCCSNAQKSDKSENNNPQTTTGKPWNVTIYLDLSDRIIRDMIPSQVQYDTIAINKIFDQFLTHVISGNQIGKSNDCFRIIAEPTPQLKEIIDMMSSLNIDLSATSVPGKKKILKHAKDSFSSAISQIYDKTLEEKNWVGCDIWGFFSSNGDLDKLCMRNGYRNIVVIITDGFLFDANHKKKEGNAYSYVTPEVLKVSPNMSLLCDRKGLQELEVLMLGVNPYTKNQGDILVPILEKWFKEMEVGKFDIVNNGPTAQQRIDYFFK